MEISSFSSEQDGFGSVQHRTPRFCFTAVEGKRETEHLAHVGGARPSSGWLRESSLMSVFVVFVWFWAKREQENLALREDSALFTLLFLWLISGRQNYFCAATCDTAAGCRVKDEEKTKPAVRRGSVKIKKGLHVKKLHPRVAAFSGNTISKALLAVICNGLPLDGNNALYSGLLVKCFVWSSYENIVQEAAGELGCCCSQLNTEVAGWRVMRRQIWLQPAPRAALDLPSTCTHTRAQSISAWLPPRARTFRRPPSSTVLGCDITNAPGSWLYIKELPRKLPVGTRRRRDGDI